MSDACASCSGRCCYNIVIRVTGLDALRISRAQALPLSAIVDAVPEEADAHGAFLASGVAHGLFLAKNAEIPAACTFLLHLPGDVQRCGIYPDRPLVCAVYPMTITNGSVDLRDDVTCARENWNFATLHYAAWRRNLARNAFEWSIYRTMVAAWNEDAVASSRAVDAYLSYLEAAGDAIEDLIAGDEASALVDRWNDAGAGAAQIARREEFVAAVVSRCRTALATN